MVKFANKFFVTWLTHEHEPTGYPLCDFQRIRYEVRPCDVLLIEGRSRVSEVIKVITQSAWSHASLYIGRLHDIENPDLRRLASQTPNITADSQLLIEGIMGKGTIVAPLSTYQKDHIRICRPRGLSPSDAQKVITYALQQVGTDYDVRQIFDLARFLFPWTILPRQWRSRLFSQNVGKSTRTVCSSIIAEAFSSIEFPILPHIQKHKETGIELIPRNPRLFTPSDFDYSPYFDIIKYPFIDFESHALYRNLPWNREGLMSHDHMGVSMGSTEAETTQPIENSSAPFSSRTENNSGISATSKKETVYPVIKKPEKKSDSPLDSSTALSSPAAPEKKPFTQTNPLTGPTKNPSPVKKRGFFSLRSLTRRSGSKDDNDPSVD